MKKLRLTRIVTHDGLAHMDDMLCIGLGTLCHGHYVPIVRRPPTPEELKDDHVLVVDIGGEYNPRHLNFDHHGIAVPKSLRGYMRDLEDRVGITERQCPASFVLLMEYVLEGKERALLGNQQFRAISFSDAYGPEVSRKAGLHMNDGLLLMSLKDLFVSGNMSAVDVVANVFTTQINKILKLDSLADVLLPVQTFPEEAVTLGVPVFEWKSAGMQPSVFLDARAAYEEKYCTKDEPSLLIAEDDRGTGWRVQRRRDNPGWDFSVLAGDERVEFVHKNGFVFTTKSKLPYSILFEMVLKGKRDNAHKGTANQSCPGGSAEHTSVQGRGGDRGGVEDHAGAAGCAPGGHLLRRQDGAGGSGEAEGSEVPADREGEGEAGPEGGGRSGGDRC